MTPHPKDLSDEVIEVMANSKEKSADTFICLPSQEAVIFLRK